MTNGFVNIDRKTILKDNRIDETYNILKSVLNHKFFDVKINSGKLLWLSFTVLNINSLLAIKSLVM